MISRLFFRFRAWLILLLFLAINISSPHKSADEETPVAQPVIVQSDATAVAEEEGFAFELNYFFEMIIEESLALYDLLPEGDWSQETTIPAITEFDVISQTSYLPPLYPPRVKRLLARNSELPESRAPDAPARPPEMNI